jgi:hypothetical protein
MSRTLAALSGLLALLAAGTTRADGLRGDYVEARTADVFTGPCFSNAEVFIYGDSALMAWKVTEGSYRGVDLAGLGVAAAVKATCTFSEDKPEQARSVLIVDEKAGPRQRDALIALAKELAGARLSHVVDVRVSRISLKIEDHAEPASAHTEHGMPYAPRASFWAPGLAQVVTRPLNDNDHFCGNEVVAYPPLSKGVSALPAYTLGNQFKGTGLNTNWDDPNCRSAFVGRFAL